MRVIVADHPLIAHKLTELRDKNTPSATFRNLVEELVTLLAYEATRDLIVEPKAIETPVAPTIGVHIANPAPIVIPILRAGLGMLNGMTRLLPSTEVGFLGMQRDENTFEVDTYAHRLPEDLSGRQVYLLDPMLATGNTLVLAINYALDRHAREVTCICILAAPEGIEAVRNAIGDRDDVRIVVAAIDDHLNEKKYIVPGLGDAGDRLYGLAH